MKRILLFFGLVLLANILIGQTTQEDTVNVKPFEDLTLVDSNTVDSSDQFLLYDISAGLFSYRISLGELGRAVSEWITTSGGTESIFKIENSSTNATVGTTDNYHTGSIGIGDFSGNTVGAGLHIYGTTNSRLRLSDLASNDTTAQAFIEFYRGYATNSLGTIGYTENTDLDLDIKNALTGGGLAFYTDNVEKMKLFADGQIRVNTYGSSLHSGTAATYAAFDANGYLIEVSGGGATAYTPLGSSDVSGNTGDIAYDDNYFYVKTSSGWQRTSLSSWTSNYINVDTMPNLFQWYVMDSLALADGAAVTTLTDFSGNNIDYSQSTVSAKPTYKANFVHGHAALDFNGSTDFFEISDLNFTADSVEIFVVVKPESSLGSPSILGAKADSSSFRISIVDSTSGAAYAGEMIGLIDIDGAGTQLVRSNEPYTRNSWQIANFNYNQTQLEIILNGTSKGTQAETAAIGNPAQKDYIGAFFETTGSAMSHFYNGQIAEIIVFSAYLSTARRTQVKNYLAEKYNITVL